MPLSRCAAISLLFLLVSGRIMAALPMNSEAPDFGLRRFDGQNLRLSELRGQVVMVNFWATWCGPCRDELPALDALYARYRDSGFLLLGINLDEKQGSAAALASRLGLRFPLLTDGGKQTGRLYDVDSMPMTYLIDRDGRVRWMHRGYRKGIETEYEAALRALLKE